MISYNFNNKSIYKSMKDKNGDFFYLLSRSFKFTAYDLRRDMNSFMDCFNLELKESVMYDVNVKFITFSHNKTSKNNIQVLNKHLYHLNGTIFIKIFEKGKPYFQIKITKESFHKENRNSIIAFHSSRKVKTSNYILKKIDGKTFQNLIQQNQIIKRIHDFASIGLINHIRATGEDYSNFIPSDCLNWNIAKEIIQANITNNRPYILSNIATTDKSKFKKTIKDEMMREKSLHYFLLKHKGELITNIDNPTFEEKKAALFSGLKILLRKDVRDKFLQDNSEKILEYIYSNIDFWTDDFLSIACYDNRIQKFLLNKSSSLIFQSPIYGHNIYSNSQEISQWNVEIEQAKKLIDYDPYIIFLLSNESYELQDYAFNEVLYTVWNLVQNKSDLSLIFEDSQFKDKRSRFCLYEYISKYNPNPKIIKKYKELDLIVNMGILNDE